jgi:hypoxanthine phosphoribosyltransferase
MQAFFGLAWGQQAVFSILLDQEQNALCFSMGILEPPMATQTVTPKLEIIYTAEQIAARVAEMGAVISRDYAGERLVLVGVLKGAAIFLADLARAIKPDCTFDFVAVTSYGKGMRSSGAVKLIKDLDQPIERRHVLLVEDILDTGLTIAYLRSMFLQHRPASLRIATFLDKPSRRLQKIEADYVGFSIPNLFVVGYGMDYAERYRNLRDICLMPSDAPE